METRALPRPLLKVPCTFALAVSMYFLEKNRRAACADSLLYPLFRGPGGKRQIIMNVRAFSPLFLVYTPSSREREREKQDQRPPVILFFPPSYSLILSFRSFFFFLLSSPRLYQYHFGFVVPISYIFPPQKKLTKVKVS